MRPLVGLIVIIKGSLSELLTQNYSHTTVANAAFPFITISDLVLYLFSGIKEHVSSQQHRCGMIIANNINGGIY